MLGTWGDKFPNNAMVADKMVSASRESLIGRHFQWNFYSVLVQQPAVTYFLHHDS